MKALMVKISANPSGDYVFTDIKGLCEYPQLIYKIRMSVPSYEIRGYYCNTLLLHNMTLPECIECLCVSSESMWEQSHGHI